MFRRFQTEKEKIPNLRSNSYEDFPTVWENTWKLIQEIDEEAKASGSNLGRFLHFGYADGYARYQLIEETKTTYKYEVLTDVGDDWVLPTLGHSGSINKKKADLIIKRADGINALFGKVR